MHSVHWATAVTCSDKYKYSARYKEQTEQWTAHNAAYRSDGECWVYGTRGCRGDDYCCHNAWAQDHTVATHNQPGIASSDWKYIATVARVKLRWKHTLKKAQGNGEMHQAKILETCMTRNLNGLFSSACHNTSAKRWWVLPQQHVGE